MIELLNKIAETGILLEVVDGKLKLFAEKEEVDPQVLDQIRTHKEELLEYLSQAEPEGNKGSTQNWAPLEAAALNEEGYVLSSAQHRLWVLSQFEGASAAYNMPNQVALTGAYDVDQLLAAIRATVARHESLRTVFRVGEDEVARQVVLPAEELDLAVQVLDLRSETHPQEAARQIIEADQYQPYDLAEGPLFRAIIAQTADEQYYFYYNLHHIISDELSLEVLGQEVLSQYHALVGQGSAPEPLAIQYKDYAVWQQTQLQNGGFGKEEAYWLSRFAEPITPVNLPGGLARPAIKTNQGKGYQVVLDGTAYQALRQLSQQEQASPFMGAVALFKALLYRYTRQNDLVIGTPTAGRALPELNPLVGMFVNMLPLRSALTENTSFLDLLKQMRGTLLDAYQHQHYPFDELVSQLALPRDISRSPLFDITVTQHEAVLEQADFPAPGQAPQALATAAVRYDIELHLREVGKGLSVSVLYNQDVYAGNMMSAFLEHFRELLKAVTVSPEAPLSSLNYLTEGERTQLSSWEGHTTQYPQTHVGAAFREQAQATPEAIAVHHPEGHTTYGDLDRMTNQLAQALMAEYEITPGDRVGIMLEKGAWTLPAVLGVLKAGGVFVPIDPAYPTARKTYLVENADLKLLITDSEYMFEVDFFEGTLLAIDIEFEAEAYADEMPAVNLQPTEGAYIMYTSGSTGEPKGVLVPHRAILRLVKGNQFLSFSAKDTLLSTGAFSFDATTVEYWGMLLNGGALVLAHNLLEPSHLAATINEYGVTKMWFTSGWFNQLVEDDVQLLAPLDTVMVGGEKLSPNHIRQVREAFPELAIINGYGPTENTTFSITHRIESVDGDIPLGKPVSNSTASIRDEFGQRVPVGVVGEIYLGGDGLALGYWNDAALTEQRFVEMDGKRLYRSGDLGY
ncbi:MAG TPA: hypothetical protein DCR93_37650, partial [Cytophagales bacterium]|nr:hypothetical protein [Cytophagales bacterium]